MVGRIDMKADRVKDELVVKQVWLEHGFGWTAARARKPEAELERMARFVGAGGIRWECRLGKKG